MKIAKWEAFQGYKKTGPPWIKLHAGLIDKPEWITLPLVAKAVLPVLWIAASRAGSDGELPDDTAMLAMLCHMQQSELNAALPSLIAAGFILCDKSFAESATNPSHAPRQILRESRGEREGETEGKGEPTNPEKPTTSSLRKTDERRDDVEDARGTLRAALRDVEGRHPGLTHQQILDLPQFCAPSGPVRLETCAHGPLMLATAAKIRAPIMRGQRKNGAPVWDRPDSQSADLQARAIAWTEEHWPRWTAIDRREDLDATLDDLSPPPDLAGEIRTHLLFGLYPHLTHTQPQEGTHA